MLDVNSRTTGAERVPAEEPVALRRLLPAVPVPTGTGSFALLNGAPGGQIPAGWDPCRPVRWVQRSDGQVPGGSALLVAAFAQVSAATGLAFTGGETTDEAPDTARAPYQPGRYGPRWAPVLVTWSDPQHSPELAGDIVGFAGPVSYRRPGQPAWYVTGQVVLDAPQLTELLAAPGGADHVRAVVLHELGHLVALAHVNDTTQVMNPRSGAGSPTTYATGDLRGLATVGASDCR